MPTYGYRASKPRYWVATIRLPNGCSQWDTLIADVGRKTAFARIASANRHGKIESLREIEATDTYHLERYGFIEPAIIPARINWSALDLYS